MTRPGIGGNDPLEDVNEMLANLVPNLWNDQDLRGGERIGARMAAYSATRLEYRDDENGHGWFYKDADGEWQMDHSNEYAYRTLHAVLGISEWIAEETNDSELREDVAYCRSNKGAWKAMTVARDRLRAGTDDPELGPDTEPLESIADLI